MNTKVSSLKPGSHLKSIAMPIAFAVMISAFLLTGLRAQADNPTLFLSTSASCGWTATNISAPLNQPVTLYVCVDADNEGSGLLGAQMNLSYSTSKMSVSTNYCSLFDTCINLSEDGAVKWLATSGPLGEGSVATSQQALGSIELNFKETGTTFMNFSGVQVIDEFQNVKSRSGVSLTINIGDEEPEEEIVEEEEEVIEEEEEVVEEPEEEPAPADSAISVVVADPVSVTAAPGAIVQVVSRADYTEGRPSENITSCFPCPTPGNPDVEGKTTYKITSGPGTFTGSKVAVNGDATLGSTINFTVSFHDYKSGTSATSIVRSITVGAPAEPAEEEVEEEVIEEELHPVAEEPIMELQEEAMELPEPDDLFCRENFSTERDEDGDGLMDRTECFIRTYPNHPDTDRDGCWDGDEMNLFYTSPLAPDDCSPSAFISEKVLITDPKPGWIISSLEITGIAPNTSSSVRVALYPALHQTLEPLVRGLERHFASGGIDEDEMEDLREKMGNLEAFLEDYPEYLTTELDEALEPFRTYLSEDSEATEEDLETLVALRTTGTHLGDDSQLDEAALGRERTAMFMVDTELVLEDGLYDLVATASLTGGRAISSAPVRVTLDKDLDANTPVPETLDDLIIDLQELFVDTSSERPVLSGKTVYGAQVFANWQSLVLTSSIIADSSEGRFSVQSPQPLDKNIDHEVTVYAVMELEDGRLARSRNVRIGFSISQQPAQDRGTLYLLILFLVLMAIAAMIAKRRMSKIDHEAPEHRAKENELYEAYRGDVHIPEEGTYPEGHKAKQKEVEAAFGEEVERLDS
ncbi:MAG: hypothetical protein OEY44_01065 [Candidatus Peregrinibacteria bacterium]|nr:hypothetical protein [Candidatus Peregrinibacteria bacterium]